MKRYIPLAALLLLAFASISFAQPTPTASPSPSASPKPAMSKAQIRSRIIATEKKLWEAWKNKDPKPFKANLSADSVMIGESGVSGKDDAIKELANAPCVVKSYELSDLKVTFLNSGAALLTYKGVAAGTCAGTAIPTVWSSSVYVNRGGRWLAVAHQETPAK
jgi:Domain of unknown function (DUF4440)